VSRPASAAVRFFLQQRYYNWRVLPALFAAIREPTKPGSTTPTILSAAHRLERTRSPKWSMPPIPDKSSGQSPYAPFVPALPLRRRLPSSVERPCLSFAYQPAVHAFLVDGACRKIAAVAVFSGGIAAPLSPQARVPCASSPPGPSALRQASHCWWRASAAGPQAGGRARRGRPRAQDAPPGLGFGDRGALGPQLGRWSKWALGFLRVRS